MLECFRNKIQVAFNNLCICNRLTNKTHPSPPLLRLFLCGCVYIYPNTLMCVHISIYIHWRESMSACSLPFHISRNSSVRQQQHIITNSTNHNNNNSNNNNYNYNWSNSSSSGGKAYNIDDKKPALVDATKRVAAAAHADSLSSCALLLSPILLARVPASSPLFYSLSLHALPHCSVGLCACACACAHEYHIK